MRLKKSLLTDTITVLAATPRAIAPGAVVDFDEIVGIGPNGARVTLEAALGSHGSRFEAVTPVPAAAVVDEATPKPRGRGVRRFADAAEASPDPAAPSGDEQ